MAHSGHLPSNLAEADPKPEVAVLIVIHHLVGMTERAGRLVFLLLVLCAAAAILELSEPARFAGAASALFLLLLLPKAAAIEIITPELLGLLPAALLLLAAPLGPRAGAGRSILGTAGGIALAWLDPPAAFVAAAAMLALTIARGGLRDRAISLVAAAATLAAGLVFSGRTQDVPDLFVAIPDGALVRQNIATALLPAGGSAAVTVAAIAIGVVVLAALLFAPAGRSARLGLLFAIAAAGAVAATVTIGGASLMTPFAWMAIVPLVVLLVVQSIAAYGGIVRAALSIALLLLVALPLREGGVPDFASRRKPLDVLARARSLKSVDSGLAIGGPDRIAARVYARLGHDPGMEIFYLPEDAVIATLAAASRRRGVRFLWLYPAEDPPPPGLERPVETRPADPVGLMPLVLDGP